jgi:hypothetical protein
VLSEKDRTDAEGALRKAADAGFEIGGTPYSDFVERYFAPRNR